jgi:protein TonB
MTETEIDTDLSKERFSFMIFLSVCVHAIIILGVGFTSIDEINSEPALEITMVQYRSEIAPDDADFLAQEDQTGSGTLDDEIIPSTPFESDFNDDLIHEVTPLNNVLKIINEINTQETVVISSFENDNQISQEIEKREIEEVSNFAEQVATDDLSLAIASLQVQLDIKRQEYAKRPRKYIISSASTQKAQDAEYLDKWRRKIEAVGNLNYPSAARRQQLYGSLRMLVSILPNGEVYRTEILQSSGYSVLDQAAVKIINLATPFQAFSKAMRAEADILEIIRTWRFHEGNAMTTY